MYVLVVLLSVNGIFTAYATRFPTQEQCWVAAYQVTPDPSLGRVIYATECHFYQGVK